MCIIIFLHLYVTRKYSQLHKIKYFTFPFSYLWLFFFYFKCGEMFVVGLKMANKYPFLTTNKKTHSFVFHPYVFGEKGCCYLFGSVFLVCTCLLFYVLEHHNINVSWGHRNIAKKGSTRTILLINRIFPVINNLCFWLKSWYTTNIACFIAH